MSALDLESFGEVGNQAKALGDAAKGAISSALYKGAQVLVPAVKAKAPAQPQTPDGRKALAFSSGRHHHGGQGTEHGGRHRRGRRERSVVLLEVPGARHREDGRAAVLRARTGRKRRRKSTKRWQKNSRKSSDCEVPLWIAVPSSICWPLTARLFPCSRRIRRDMRPSTRFSRPRRSCFPGSPYSRRRGTLRPGPTTRPTLERTGVPHRHLCQGKRPAQRERRAASLSQRKRLPPPFPGCG